MASAEELDRQRAKLKPVAGFEYKKYNVGIVGAGAGCIAIFEMVNGQVMKQFKMNIVAVCDVNPDAPGMIEAKKLGIQTVTADYKKLFDIEGLNMIIELTGNKGIRDEIFRTKPQHVHLIDHVAARFLWDLYEAHIEKIEMEVISQQRIDEEHNRIKQIFDNLPDSILVIDPDMVVRDVNKTFLDINKVTEDDVVGKYCYDVGHTLKGECQITDDYCPMRQVMKSKTVKKSIQHHIDTETGKDVYVSLTMAPMLDDHRNVIGVIEACRDISYRIKLEEELVQSKIRLEKFMEAAPFFIAIKNLSGQYIQINKTGCDDLGLQFQQIIAKTDLEILPAETANHIKKNDNKVIRRKKDMISAEKIERKGVTHYYQTTRFPIFDHKNDVSAICVIAQDVTALRETQMKLERKQKELEETKEYLQSILEHSSSIIFTSDMKGDIVSFNRCAEKLTGYSREEVTGKPAKMLYDDPEEREKVVQELEVKDSVPNREMRLRKKDGKTMDVDATISKLFDNNGVSIGLVGIFHDITPRKIVQQQLIRTDRLVAVGKLGAGVAHEINNPTAVISEAVGWMQELIDTDKIIKSSPNFEEIMTTAETIKKQSVRIADITHRLLGFASQTETTAEKVDINSVIKEVLKFTIDIKKMSNIKVGLDLTDGLPELNLNLIQLQQTFVNIIDNAVDAIGSEKGNINISTMRDDQHVVVEIVDDGPGIPKDVIDNIFDPFVTTKPVGKGTGLGLSICFGIIKQMGGMIEVESEVGKGATFRISLPIVSKKSKK